VIICIVDSTTKPMYCQAPGLLIYDANIEQNVINMMLVIRSSFHILMRLSLMYPRPSVVGNTSKLLIRNSKLMRFLPVSPSLSGNSLVNTIEPKREQARAVILAQKFPMKAT
jgi:hypothetical protein